MNPVTMRLSVDPIILRALEEDVPAGDVTTEAVMPEPRRAEVRLVAKQDGVICGLDVFARTFELLDPTSEVRAAVADGDEVAAGQELAVVAGDVRALLSGERVALNLLQRMSGVATTARAFARAVEGTGAALVDTRKTTPGLRVLEKHAVRVGGGRNHRDNLSDGVLLKDNHIDAAGGVRQAVEAARARASFVRKVEVEVETLDMVREALEAGADVIMLDNMGLDEMREAVRLIAGRAEVEASGNVTLDTVRAVAETGVDLVSSGALTHSAPILDLSLKHLCLLDEDGAA